jgi:hypothetical protein
VRRVFPSLGEHNRPLSVLKGLVHLSNAARSGRADCRRRVQPRRNRGGPQASSVRSRRRGLPRSRHGRPDPTRSRRDRAMLPSRPSARGRDDPVAGPGDVALDADRDRAPGRPPAATKDGDSAPGAPGRTRRGPGTYAGRSNCGCPPTQLLAMGSQRLVGRMPKMSTRSAWLANAVRSSTSPVRTTPPGSAVATRIASIADPRRAR